MNRRRCYLAPERLIGSGGDGTKDKDGNSTAASSFPNDGLNENTSALAALNQKDDGSSKGASLQSRMRAMDVYSCGCVLAELYLNGSPLIVDLPELLKYRNESETFKRSVLLGRIAKIDDVLIRNLVTKMVAINPAERPSAAEALASLFYSRLSSDSTNLLEKTNSDSLTSMFRGQSPTTSHALSLDNFGELPSSLMQNLQPIARGEVHVLSYIVQTLLLHPIYQQPDMRICFLRKNLGEILGYFLGHCGEMLERVVSSDNSGGVGYPGSAPSSCGGRLVRRVPNRFQRKTEKSNQRGVAGNRCYYDAQRREWRSRNTAVSLRRFCHGIQQSGASTAQTGRRKGKS